MEKSSTTKLWKTKYMSVSKAPAFKQYTKDLNNNLYLLKKDNFADNDINEIIKTEKASNLSH